MLENWVFEELLKRSIATIVFRIGLWSCVIEFDARNCFTCACLQCGLFRREMPIELVSQDLFRNLLQVIAKL